MSPLDLDQQFFDALTSADVPALDRLLHPDLLIVAVHDGAVATRAELIDAVGSGAVAFPAIATFPEEASVRTVGDVDVVVGRTAMEFTGFAAASRYTHVWTRGRLLSAQGTPIAGT
jgi:ketosteroid isomerase-like protein